MLFITVNLFNIGVHRVEVYLWNPVWALQPSTGAHAAEFFVMRHHLFLAIANFGDRQNNRYMMQSRLMPSMSYVMQDEGANRRASGEDECVAEMRNIATAGCAESMYVRTRSRVCHCWYNPIANHREDTGWEYFELDRRREAVFSGRQCWRSWWYQCEERCRQCEERYGRSLLVESASNSDVLIQV